MDTTMAKNLTKEEIDAKGMKMLKIAFAIFFSLIAICSFCFGFVGK